MSYEFIDIRCTASDMLQITIKKSESVKEGQILSVEKNPVEYAICVVEEVEQYPDVTMILASINPELLDEDFAETINQFNKIKCYGHI